MQNKLALPGGAEPNDLDPTYCIELASSFLSLTGLKCQPYTRSDLLVIARATSAMESMSLWVRGDAALLLVEDYGLGELCLIFDCKMGTLLNSMTTAKTWPMKERIEELSFSHHAALNATMPDQRLAYLSSAVEEELSVDDLRRRVMHNDPNGDKQSTGNAITWKWPNKTVGVMAEHHLEMTGTATEVTLISFDGEAKISIRAKNGSPLEVTHE